MYSKLKEVIGSRAHVVILTHINPDGDAIGSILGLYWFLKEKGCAVSMATPNHFPDFLNWMEGAREIIDFEKKRDSVIAELKRADLVFFLDCNEPDRLGGIKNHLDGLDAETRPGAGILREAMLSARPKLSRRGGPRALRTGLDRYDWKSRWPLETLLERPAYAATVLADMLASSVPEEEQVAALAFTRLTGVQSETLRANFQPPTRFSLYWPRLQRGQLHVLGLPSFL